MSRRRKKLAVYQEHAAGIVAEVALAAAIFVGGLIVILVLGYLFG